MKKILMIALMLVASMNIAFAQAQIKFDKLSYDFGDFSESSAVQKCNFTFTNVGDQPLVINQAVASCGCTVPTYTKTPIKPGEKGSIVVTYNGKGKFPGHFKKTITVRTNGVPEMTRLYVEGNMEEAKTK
ncbi:MAG: DUF1573 domain-containing protein [Bacteroidota bacterium]|nr:DUF1573 domain-containing protein [Bacteroidota bacterium]